MRLSEKQETDEERAIAALVGAGRTLNAWGEPIHAVERELNIPTAAARVLVEALQHRGVVRVRKQKTSGFPRLHWWIRSSGKPAAKGSEL
jgi:hypothetical protein